MDEMKKKFEEKPSIFLLNQIAQETSIQDLEGFLNYLEEKIEILKTLSKVSILTFFNRIQKRIWKSNNFINCKILLLLSKIFPLCDKSQVNINHEFNYSFPIHPGRINFNDPSSYNAELLKKEYEKIFINNNLKYIFMETHFKEMEEMYKNDLFILQLLIQFYLAMKNLNMDTKHCLQKIDSFSLNFRLNLERDQDWLEWKKKKCENFEKEPFLNFQDKNKEEIIEKKESIQQASLPSSNDYLDFLKQQIEPDTELVREETLYSNNVYMWKIRRLLWNENLSKSTNKDIHN